MSTEIIMKAEAMRSGKSSVVPRKKGTHVSVQITPGSAAAFGSTRQITNRIVSPANSGTSAVVSGVTPNKA